MSDIDLLSQLNATIKEKERYRLALEGLTPGGSEYVSDPERCVAFIRQSRTNLFDIVRERSRQIHELKEKVTHYIGRVWELERERDRLYTRLEMNTACDMDGQEISIPPGSTPDGIETRDSTIELLEDIIKELKGKVKKQEAILGEARRITDKIMTQVERMSREKT